MYKKFRPGLIGFAISIIHSPDDAEEIVQDVFLAIYNNSNIKLEAAGVKSYLFTSVKNRCLNFIRKSKLDYATMPDELPTKDGGATAQALMEAKESESKIQLLIDQLPNKCKQVFILSRMYELSYKEIAEVMDISPKTVENQISIALKFLKENFSKN